MAQKRIKFVQYNPLADRIRLLYDDGTQGEINYPEDSFNTKIPGAVKPSVEITSKTLVGLTLKQAKMKLGIKK